MAGVLRHAKLPDLNIESMNGPEDLFGRAITKMGWHPGAREHGAGATAPVRGGSVMAS